MTKTMVTAAAATIAMAVGSAAATASQDRIPELQRPGAMNATGITLTGCVARGTANDSYTLAEENKAAAAATAPEVATARELVALAGTDVDMSKHVGHKVAITGTYASTEGVAGTAGLETAATTATIDSSKKAAKIFTVKSLKMVAAFCETAGE